LLCKAIVLVHNFVKNSFEKTALKLFTITNYSTFALINFKQNNNMKKIILIVAIALTANFANAQDAMKFGVRGGVDMVSAKADVTYVDPLGGVHTSSSSFSTTGFYVGGFVDFSIADKMVLEPGIAYHAASKDDFKLNFLSIPVTFKYEIATKFNIMAGPSLFYNMDSDAQDKTTFNFDIGASYDITDNFFVDPRYSLGLSGDTKVNHLLIGVGYKF